MNVARVLRIAALMVGVAATMAVIGLFIWFWRGQMPSADARHLEALFLARKPPADAGNAFLDLYGFSAPVGVDVHAHGAQRMAWLRRNHQNAKTAGDDPVKNDLDFNELRSSASRRIGEVCREGSVRICAEAVAAVTAQQPMSTQEPLLLARYRALLDRPDWYEPLVFRAADPLPTYHAVIEAQRVTMILLRQSLLRGDTAGARDTLQRDLRFWRMGLRSTDALIGKMIAVAAIRAHFVYANLALRDLPPQRALELIPDSWREPLTDDERSMWRCLSGEYMFMATIVSEMYAEGSMYSDDEFGTPIQRAFGRLRRQFDPQRQLNARARLLAGIAREFSAPLDRYPQAGAALERELKGQDDVTGTAMYALRAASVEGMRRAALLAFELRGRSVPAGDVAAELEKSRLRGPFDNQPFEWNAAEQSIVYRGPEEKRRGLALLY